MFTWTHHMSFSEHADWHIMDRWVNKQSFNTCLNGIPEHAHAGIHLYRLRAEAYLNLVALYQFDVVHSH